ncbi:MAG: hypothetical protein C0467_23880 [Planctomycetaceae bacterium]|nr:hypothetical protein [Planctomycetaceae bacterium]
MAIPPNAAIESELLALLATSPNGRIRTADAYDELAELHPELTVEERTLRFRESASQWANRVQFCRQHLVERGFIYPAGEGPHPNRGVWIITAAGREFQSCLV